VLPGLGALLELPLKPAAPSSCVPAVAPMTAATAVQLRATTLLGVLGQPISYKETSDSDFTSFWRSCMHMRRPCRSCSGLVCLLLL
jgi:hypothetical protein